MIEPRSTPRRRVEVFGVSFDTPEDNRAFAEKYDFPFRLLSDTTRELATALGAAEALTDQYPPSRHLRRRHRRNGRTRDGDLEPRRSGGEAVGEVVATPRWRCARRPGGTLAASYVCRAWWTFAESCARRPWWTFAESYARRPWRTLAASYARRAWWTLAASYARRPWWTFAASYARRCHW